MTNLAMASEILSRFWAVGVRDIVVCAGARNAPFVTLLARETPFRVHSFFDERSAAFFALGKILNHGAPVAVVTTSGTAAAELLPATIEAEYQGLPLILLTADRPRRFRGTGAPQSIVQPGIFSHYVELNFDLENEALPEWDWSMRRPIHLNVCFDEPLLSGAAELNFTTPVASVMPIELEARQVEFSGKAPLIILSAIPDAERVLVLERVLSWRRPIYAEATSGLRGALAEFEVRGGDKSLKNLEYDSVIRIGRVPTLRLWRDLETSDIPVLHFSDLNLSGLPRVRTVYSFAEFKEWNAPKFENGPNFLDLQPKLEELIKKHARSEVSWVRALSQQIPDGARVFLGNSLPIREWDLAATRDVKHEIFANRGVNGIDGLISTFLGLADEDKSNWAVIGDLSALYDLNAGWALRELQIDINLVVLNNGGGEIFKRMFRTPLFENRHGLNLSAFAKLWDWEYVEMREPRSLARQSQRPRLIEIFPDTEVSEAFWADWEKA